MNSKKYVAEVIGTFWLTFAGCGSAVIAAAFPQGGSGCRGVTGIRVERRDHGLCDRPYLRLPSQSGVTVGLAAGGRFPGQISALCHRAGDRRGRGLGAAVCDCERRCGFDVSKGLRRTVTTRIRRAITA